MHYTPVLALQAVLQALPIDGEFGDGDRRFGLLVRGVTAINVSVKLID